MPFNKTKGGFKLKKPPRVWTEEEKGDRACLVVTVKEFERIVLDIGIEFFLKRERSPNQTRVVLLLPRHIKVSRIKLPRSE